MTDDVARSGAGRGRHSRQIVGYAVTALSVWLAWEVLKAPVAARAPPSLAIRVAPGSPEVLQRAAEAEFAAERFDNARYLAEKSLSRAPFNARSLRVRGLVEAKGADTARANDLLTLAGNWSLRDDPTHAWLMENRLRQGAYGSSFAHADTLARRRADLYPQIFRLFTTAAATDPRSVPSLVGLLAASPPWRNNYLNSLYERDEHAPVLAALAVGLEKTAAPLTNSELGHLYRMWASKGLFSGIRYLRTELRRPNPSVRLQNGSFSTQALPEDIPFQWRFGAAPGVAVQISEDDLGRGGGALRVQYDGRQPGVLAEQLMILPPGRIALSGQARFELPTDDAGMRWTIRCVETDTVVASALLSPPAPAGGPWKRWMTSAEIPAAACTAQWLRLETLPGERRRQIVIWFDNIRID